MNSLSILPARQWQQQAQTYMREIYPYTSAFRERRARRRPHPIYDFLFTYYAFSTRKLEQWHPGLGRVLELRDDPLSDGFRRSRHYECDLGTAKLRSDTITPARLGQLEWIHNLCRTIAARKPRFACYGLHEWAMVYRSPEIRHAYPLRLSADRVAELLENNTVCCSHFDAFRFFSPPAVRLNVIQPTESTRLENEQGGCIHANMDLYKWAFKSQPFLPSEFVADCFMLALRAREIDMRASPYDFRELGFDPIKIETAAGREEYRLKQIEISEAAAALRSKLVEEIELVMKHLKIGFVGEAGPPNEFNRQVGVLSAQTPP